MLIGLEKLRIYEPVELYGEFINFEDVKDLISSAPSVPPAQKTAQWIEIDDIDFDVCKCSECGMCFCLIVGTPKDNLYHYCPNCGIKMN